MQVYGAPGAVFAVEQLFWTLQFIIVVLCRTAIGTAPVLDDVPVGALATITGGDKALIATGGVETADDIAALLCEVLRQYALVLQSPQDDGG